MTNIKYEIINEMVSTPSFSPLFRRTVNKAICAIGDDLVDLQGSKYRRIRDYLNSLLCPKGNAVFNVQITSLIWMIKKYSGTKNIVIPKDEKNLMSDHCFVRYLERELGVDVLRAKDRVLEDIKKSGLTENLVTVNGRYVTYINY